VAGNGELLRGKKGGEKAKKKVNGIGWGQIFEKDSHCGIKAKATIKRTGE